METFEKDPAAVLDWLFKWIDWLESGETITTHTITVDTGITDDSSAIVDSSKNVEVFLSGGTAGQFYLVACLITTSAARTDERTIRIQVLDR